MPSLSQNTLATPAEAPARLTQAAPTSVEETIEEALARIQRSLAASREQLASEAAALNSGSAELAKDQGEIVARADRWRPEV